MKRALTLLVASALSLSAFAATDTSKAQAALQKLGLPATELAPAPLDGFYQVVTPQGLLYISADGARLLHGNIYDVENGMANLTELAMGELRQTRLSDVEDSMIVYPAKDEKYVVTVFTDISCGYCRKLHNDMAGYNERGITIRYLAFPRGGQGTSAWREMESVWCAADPAKAMTQAKASGKAGSSQSCDNKVAEHYALGGAFGVSGTPALVLTDGTLVPGYLPPERLLMALQTQ
ncbi:bifunctional protein-disulfide isomerase/oxidoreductase DsbC [Ferrimonas pelagia]|uniref:Thiol:disulfide interchange protein n=1 Tax=Ferrimonas pelagia TaxID=1177826 RepID=A0ABP9EI24_9GAMM